MSPVRFRKKPVEVVAVQWMEHNEPELIAFTGGKFEAVAPENRAEKTEITGQVYDVLHSTWVGILTGQWVIRGVQGEFYPIDETVLAETYERVEASDADS
jgi:hypothetical protein